jgi:hypothetical protein
MAEELVAYFFERDDAEEVGRRLSADGIEAEVRRDRFHGEDDDEDHPWTVIVTDPAASGLLESLTAEHDGWLSTHETAAETAAAQVDAPPLPDGPRRFKNA